MPPAEDKKILRQKMLARRKVLADQSPEAATRMARLFAQRFPLSAEIRLAGFWPMASEIDVRPILGAHLEKGGACVLPRVAGKGQPLSFRRWTSEAVLDTSPFGVSEPPESAPEARPDVLLVPLLAFDRRGYRLGYGGGYYDLSLALLRKSARPGREPIAIGVAFEGQEVDSLPAESFDQRLDWVLTPSEVRRFGETS